MKKTFNNITKFIQVFIIRTIFKTVLPGTDHRNTSLINDICSKSIRVIGSVGNDSVAGITSNQRRSLCHIMTRTCRQDKAQWQKGITYSRMEFRGKATMTATQGFTGSSFIFFSGHPLQMNAPERSLNPRGAQRSHRHHGNVHGVFQRPQHHTICRNVYR